MAQAYPAEMIQRAKELWLASPSASFDAVAKALNTEFGARITRKTIHQWSEFYGWSRSDDTALTAKPPVEVQKAGPTSLTAQRHLVPPLNDEEYNWERKRVLFLAKLAGVAETCLDIQEGGELRFRDDDSRLRTGMAAVELLGKINSGKFEPPEQGDKVPQLDESKVNAIINFFVVQGAPEPKLGPVINITQEDDGANRNGQGAGTDETSRVPLLDRARDND